MLSGNMLFITTRVTTLNPTRTLLFKNISHVPVVSDRFRRAFHTTFIIRSASKEKKNDTKADEGEESVGNSSPMKATNQRPTINRVGVPFIPYICPRRSRLPSPLSSPIVFVKCLFKRVYMSCYNWVNVYKFKNTMGKGYKPNFVKWKNEAIEIYVKVNQSFADKKIAGVRELMSDYVYISLKHRQKELPKDVTLGWELVKFNAPPKLISFHAFPHEDGSVLLCQIIYRFQTKQKMVVKRKTSKKLNAKVKDLTEYISFNIDPFTDDCVIAGSVFESIPERPLSQGAMPTQTETINMMIKNGDIYRPEPSYSEQLAETKKKTSS